ncbi:MAG TPA: hypothetical protein VHX16_09155 [Chloroflexota bacterium]|nr:hypothetical protein [Chloroflexota bacterium]
MDREQAREQAQTLLDRWVREPDSHDQLIGALGTVDPASVEMVGALEHPEAGELLAAVAAGPVSKDLRKGARRGLHRLRASGKAVPTVQLVTNQPMLRLNVEHRLAEARVSAPDGIGSRWLWLFVERSTGGGFTCSLMLNEIVGIKSMHVSEMTRRRYAQLIQDMIRQSEIQLYELPTDYARALLAQALELNQATGFNVPTEIHTYRSILGDFGAPPERALIYDFVSAAEIRLEPAYLAQSAELAGEPEAEHWIFDFHAVRPFAEQARQTDSSLVVLHETSRQERLERIQTEAIRAILTDEVRDGLRRRLEETAYIFWITGRQRAARMAVAAAIALEQPIVSSSIIVRVDRGPSRVQHPFIRELLRRSIEIANELELSGMADRVPRRTPYDPVDN